MADYPICCIAFRIRPTSVRTGDTIRRDREGCLGGGNCWRYCYSYKRRDKHIDYNDHE